MIAAAAAGLAVPATATASESLPDRAASVGTVSCFDGSGSTGGGDADPSIQYSYLHGGSRFCTFSSQFDWINAIRDATVRGLQGGDYRSISVFGGGDDGTEVLAQFSGAGATGTVQTGGFNDGPSGWKSESKIDCHTRFEPSGRTGMEGLMIKDYMYHLEQVVRSNSNGYSGTTVVSGAKIVAPSGNSAVYLPHCSDLS